MLKTWDDIRRVLQTYPVRAEGPEVTTFDWPAKGPVSAKFQVAVTDILNRQRIFIGVNVAADTPAAAHEALVVNSETVIGALAAFKGKLLLKHAMTVGGFDDAELHEVLATMAMTAEVVGGRLLAPTPAPAPKLYTSYVD